MCNARALLITAAVAGAVYTGGASLGLLGAGAGAGAAAGGAAAAAGTTGAVYGGAAAATSSITALQAAGLASAAVSATSAWQQQRTASAVASANANVAGQRAQQDENIGELNAQKVQEQGSQLIGTQRATMAARGLDLGQGTPADILSQSAFYTQQDAATARYNGQLAAWGDRQQQGDFAAQARGDGASAGLSLLYGAGSVADKWYRNGASPTNANTTWG